MLLDYRHASLFVLPPRCANELHFRYWFVNAIAIRLTRA